MKKLAYGLFSLSTFMLSGCLNTAINMGQPVSTVSGSASSEAHSARGESSLLQKCTEPFGVAALVEPRDTESYSRYGLPSPLPVLRLIMAQSNCFQVVDRGMASEALQRERELAKQGELRQPSKVKGGQMVAADWVMTPEILFQDKDAGGGGGGLGALLPGLVGAVAGAITVENMEAQAQLSLINIQTSLQDAVAVGSAKKSDIGLGGLAVFSSAAGAGGAYQSTDIGKIVMAAFFDAHNQLVNQMRTLQ